MKKIPESPRVRLPWPRPWSEPITQEQFEAYASAPAVMTSGGGGVGV